MNEQLCTYYEQDLDICGLAVNKLGVKQCKQGFLCKDGTCKVNGQCFDKFKYKDITNFEYKRNYVEKA